MEVAIEIPRTALTYAGAKWEAAMWQTAPHDAVLYACRARGGCWTRPAELFPAVCRDGLKLLPQSWEPWEGRIFAVVRCISPEHEFSAIVREVWADGLSGPYFALGDDPCRELPMALLMPCVDACAVPCDAGCAGLLARELRR